MWFVSEIFSVQQCIVTVQLGFSFRLILILFLQTSVKLPGYPDIDLALDHPVWVVDDHPIDQTAAAVVDGDPHTCTNTLPIGEFSVIDLGFGVAVDKVIIFAPSVVGSINLYNA